MLRALGEELKRARKKARASLEKVAGAAGISAPYLLKLERGLVGSPSPRVLARLATSLGMPYLHLMELAGYLDEEQLVELRARAPRPHPLADQTLAPEEWQEVAALIKQILSRRHRPRG
jgi:transcriptional regulator with XRE-family HTH domain